MHTSIGTGVALAALLLLPPATAGALPEEGAAHWLSRLQRFYEQTRDLDVAFSQRVTVVSQQDDQTATGRLKIKKPGMMRWDYLQPERKLMVTDGDVMWTYVPDDHLVARGKLRTQMVSSMLLFLFGKGDLAAEFHVRKLEGTLPAPLRPGEGVALELRPKKPSARYSLVHLVVDPQSGEARRVVIVDPLGTRNEIGFSNMRTNRGLKNGLFAFQPPAGLKILRLP
jgi:outer membrane lipoprotein carrier protein